MAQRLVWEYWCQRSTKKILYPDCVTHTEAEIVLLSFKTILSLSDVLKCISHINLYNCKHYVQGNTVFLLQ